MKQVKENIKRKCPNCGNKSLAFLLGMWICHECEYHTEDLKKKSKGTFR